MREAELFALASVGANCSLPSCRSEQMGRLHQVCARYRAKRTYIKVWGTRQGTPVPWPMLQHKAWAERQSCRAEDVYFMGTVGVPAWAHMDREK